MTWKMLGAVRPEVLTAARSQAHWAAQVLAAVGETHVPHTLDTSHTAMEFSPGQESLEESLVGVPLETPSGQLRSELSVGGLTLRLLGPDGRVLEQKPLAGLTLKESLAWMSAALERRSDGFLDGMLTRPSYALPPHPLAGGARFEAVPSELAELSRWYANANIVLERVAQGEEATPILCWPHHFDVARLLVVERSDASEMTKTIGVGLSPGDDIVPEPYLYVNHWAAAPGDAPSLPDLPVGSWHTDGFLAAVLAGSDLASQAGAAEQESAANRFLSAAIAASREIIS